MTPFVQTRNPRFRVDFYYRAFSDALFRTEVALSREPAEKETTLGLFHLSWIVSILFYLFRLFACYVVAQGLERDFDVNALRVPTTYLGGNGHLERESKAGLRIGDVDTVELFLEISAQRSDWIASCRDDDDDDDEGW